MPWTDVSSVFAPHPGGGPIRLQLVNGAKVPLDIPADRCAEVAALGGKDVIRPVLPTVQSGPPLPPRPRTDGEVLADVSRQAQELARQRVELAALSRRLKP